MRKRAIGILATVGFVFVTSCSWQVRSTQDGTVKYDDAETIVSKFTDDEKEVIEIEQVLQNLKSEFHIFLPNLIANTKYITIIKSKNSHYSINFSEAEVNVGDGGLNKNSLTVRTSGPILMFEPIEKSKNNSYRIGMLYYGQGGMSSMTTGEGRGLLWFKSIKTSEFSKFIPTSQTR